VEAMSFNDYTINQHKSIPAAMQYSTFDFMARMGVVHAADNSFAGVGGSPQEAR